MTICVRRIQRKARNRKAVNVVGSRKKGGSLLPSLPLYEGSSNATTKMKSSDGSKRSLRDMTLPSSPRQAHPFHALRVIEFEARDIMGYVHRILESTTGITCLQNSRVEGPIILYKSPCFVVVNMKGIMAMLSGFHVVSVMVRRMPRVLVVPKGIQQRNGSVDHQDRAEKDLHDKYEVL